MSDNHDLLNDNDMCSFSGYEVDDMCSNRDNDTCGDGVIAVQEMASLSGLECFIEVYIPVFLAGKMYIEFSNCRYAVV